MAKSPGRPRGRPPGRKTPLYNRPESRYDPPWPEEKEPTPNFDLLSEDTKDELRAKAKAKVDAAEIERAEAAFLAAEKERLEKALHPEVYEPEEEVTIDCALYADRITIDGKVYWHGRTYKMKENQRKSVMDIMARTHKHYADTHRDPNKVLMESAQAVAKGGKSYATINASTGQVTKF
jgi:hypothetical protein